MYLEREYVSQRYVVLKDNLIFDTEKPFPNPEHTKDKSEVLFLNDA